MVSMVSGHLLCDGLRIVRAKGIVDGHEVIGTIVLNMEEWEGDKYDVFLRSSDLPLTASFEGVIIGVPRR